jgi:hypothetical protein
MFIQLVTDLLQLNLLSSLGLFNCPDSQCTGSAFNPMAAAMATQGYWAQADIVELLQISSMKNLAILFYVCAAIGGLISMALGMPPKLYLWFFMGPALYHFLLGTPVSVLGTRWEIAGIPQNQSEVWKLAYPGIEGTRAYNKAGISIQSIPLGNSTLYLPPNIGTGEGANVSWFFAYYDWIVSGVIQTLTSWFGPYSSVPGSGGTIRTYDANQTPWYLLSNLKWGMLETITSAKFSDAALRDIFVTFLSSECGDRFKKAVNVGALAQANTAPGKSLPFSAFWSAEEVIRQTDTYTIPTPFTFAALIRDGDTARTNSARGGAPGTFLRASRIAEAVPANTDILNAYGASQSVTCSQLLWAIVVGARWEAGHTYARLMGQAPTIIPTISGLGGLGALLGNLGGQKANPGFVTHNLFFGWELPPSVSGQGSNIGGWLGNIFQGYQFFGNQNDAAQSQFLIDLITAHIFRNEFAMAPPISVSKGTDSEGNKTYADIYTRTVGAKSKFGELYVWALMIPYLQGLFLYYLAIAYPFVCVCMVVPGWHKMFFSWMAFWLWVKLWDLGFAIVMMAERGVWAMLGNSSDAANVFSRLSEMSKYSTVGVRCTESTLLGGSISPYSQAFSELSTPPCMGGQIVDVVVAKAGSPAPMSLMDAVKTLDLGMLLGASMDLDRANAYYIYLMAAMYFAVPMVTGQLVLGSKAAVAGMVKEFIGGAASEGGRAAGSAFTASQTAAASANAASQSQAAALKAMRQQGLALGALRAGNQGLLAGARGAAAQQESQGMGAMSQAMSAAEKQQGAALRYRISGLRAHFAASALGQALNALNVGYQQNDVTGGSEKVENGLTQIRRQVDGARANQRALPNDGRPAFSGSGAGTGGSGYNAKREQSLWSLIMGVHSSGNVVESGYAATVLHGRNMVVDAVQGTGDAQIGISFAGASAKIGALQSEYGIAGFGYSQQAQGYNLNQGRMQAGAEFGAQQSAWLERANYANAVSPMLAAYGVSPGTISAGQKPDNLVGASWNGQLGSIAQSESQYAQEGGEFFKWVNKAQSTLEASYGYGSILNQYQINSRTPDQALAEASAPFETWDLVGPGIKGDPFSMLPSNTAYLSRPVTGRIEHEESRR